MKENVMNTIFARSTLAAGLALSLAGAAHAAPAASNAFGTPAAANAAERTVVLGDQTRYINVNDGETVRFVHGDRSFTWNFDTVRRDGVAALGQIAPMDFGDAGAKVYIAQNPLYNNG
jgi:hypothetical protein